jgi:hypothetical protein
MIRTPTDERLFRLRLLPKDLGVALVALAAFGLAWLVMQQATGRTREFRSEDTPLRLSYPAGWSSVDSLQDVLLKVEDPLAPSAFKTSLSVEERLLDPAAPPTLQSLLDRRVSERGQLTGYHFIDEQEALVGGQRAIRSDYAYVVQPIDEPRRPSLPVVVLAREYIVISGERSFYLTLAAPEADWERASARFEQIVAGVQLQ